MRGLLGLVVLIAIGVTGACSSVASSDTGGSDDVGLDTGEPLDWGSLDRTTPDTARTDLADLEILPRRNGAGDRCLPGGVILLWHRHQLCAQRTSG